MGKMDELLVMMIPIIDNGLKENWLDCYRLGKGHQELGEWNKKAFKKQYKPIIKKYTDQAISCIPLGLGKAAGLTLGIKMMQCLLKCYEDGRDHHKAGLYDEDKYREETEKAISDGLDEKYDKAMEKL